MMLREPDEATGWGAVPDNPVGRAVAVFAERTWPGEAMTAAERRELERRAGCGAWVETPDSGGTVDAPTDDAVARRMDAALAVARKTRDLAARVLAKRGALRPFACETRPGTSAWALDLAALGVDGPLALDRHGRLRDALRGLVDLWVEGDRPALVLVGGPADAGAAEELRAWCETLLCQFGTGRGWDAQPEVLRIEAP